MVVELTFDRPPVVIFERRRQLAAIRVRNNALREETFQSAHVTLLGGIDKGFQKAQLLARTNGRAPAIRDMFTGTGDELAAVCLLHLQDVGDLVVRVIECLSQNICGAFRGREFLKEQQDRKAP
jgi:hypothetical protein